PTCFLPRSAPEAVGFVITGSSRNPKTPPILPSAAFGRNQMPVEGRTRHLHDPSGGETIPLPSVCDADDINAERQLVKERCDLSHTASPSGLSKAGRRPNSDSPDRTARVQ